MRFVFLNNITDPQNFGAILRNAFFLGIDGILVNKKNRISLTPAVSKVSAGALELMDVYCVFDSPVFLENCKKRDFKILALDYNLEFYEKNLEIGELVVGDEENLIVVLGNEGRGISEQIRGLCDFAVFVRGGDRVESFPGSLVDSLNVGVVSGLIMERIRLK